MMRVWGGGLPMLKGEPVQMAVRTILVDDMDGGDADVTIAFVVNGESYSIDLSNKNAERFWDALAPWIEVASRKVSERKSSIETHLAGVEQRAVIRAWARKRGMEVSSRGRIPQDIIEEYNKHNQGK